MIGQVPHPSTAANSSLRDRRNAVATYSLWNTYVGVVEVRAAREKE